MKTLDCELIEVTKNDFVAFGIWHKRFADEYNRSKQMRVGRLLVNTITLDHWLRGFVDQNVPSYWIKHKNQTIGFANVQIIKVGKNPFDVKNMSIVSDVYVAPKYRGKKVLAQVLLMLRMIKNIKSILIDGQKLIDHAGYYYRLGFKYSILWPEQELWIVSTEKEHNFNWTDIFPNIKEETV